MNYGGFFGKFSLGAAYRFNEYNDVETTLGFYTVDKRYYHQLNLAYRHSPWQITWDDQKWNPVLIGIFGVVSLDNEDFFMSSPSKYPGGYYDQTAYRYGFEFGSKYGFSGHHIELSYYLRILDSGLVALYNNAHRDLQYYMSSGLSLFYLF